MANLAARFPSGPPGLGRVVASAVVVFLLAILTARLLLTGKIGWAAVAVASPFLIVVLALILGFLGAIVVFLFFTGSVLAVRAFIVDSSFGWAVLLLIPVGMFTLLIASRVLQVLFARRGQGPADPSGTPPRDADPAHLGPAGEPSAPEGTATRSESGRDGEGPANQV